MTKDSSMKPADPRILTINGGSSSIKFALFEAGDALRRITDKEQKIAKTVCRVLGLGLKKEN